MKQKKIREQKIEKMNFITHINVWYGMENYSEWAGYDAWHHSTDIGYVAANCPDQTILKINTHIFLLTQIFIYS